LFLSRKPTDPSRWAEHPALSSIASESPGLSVPSLSQPFSANASHSSAVSARNPHPQEHKSVQSHAQTAAFQKVVLHATTRQAGVSQQPALSLDHYLEIYDQNVLSKETALEPAVLASSGDEAAPLAALESQVGLRKCVAHATNNLRVLISKE
jgi:hypothetical protein